MPESTRHQVELLLRAGAPIVLQRVPLNFDLREFARSQGAPVVQDPFEGGTGVVLVDAREADATRFSAWDERRNELLSGGQRVVILLAASGRALAANAPHVASAAGGVLMPVEPTARLCVTDEEKRLGERLLRQAKADTPVLSELHGVIVGVDLQTERLFYRQGLDPRQLAAQELDHAVLFTEYLP